MKITTHYGANIELHENHNFDDLWTLENERLMQGLGTEQCCNTETSAANNFHH